jgi:hypothetical protein
MIDNFNEITEILNKKNITQDNFIFLQILKRKKDNPDMDSHVAIIQNYYLSTVDHLLAKREEIIKQCDIYNARAYIRLNLRSHKKIALETLSLIARNIASENYHIKNCFDSCCGQFSADPDKTWVIDFDYDKTNFDEVLDINKKTKYIQSLIRDTGSDDTVHELKTKNGSHLICPPFHVAKYIDKYGELSYHKDNPTILYIPSTWM